MDHSAEDDTTKPPLPESLEGGKEKEGDQNKKSDDGILKRRPFASIREWVMGGVGAASAVLHIIHIPQLAVGRQKDLSPGVKGVGYASSGFGLAVAPYAIFNETQMAQEGSLRKALENLRSEVNRFVEENKKLGEEITKLERNVDTMQEIEGALTELTKRQGSDLDSFMGLIRENKEMNAEMRELLKAKAIEDVTTLVLQSDHDGDFHLEGSEVEELIYGMRLIEDIEVDEDVFRKQILDARGSLIAVLRLVKELLQDGSSDWTTDKSSRKGGKSCLKLKDSQSILEVGRSSFLRSIRSELGTGAGEGGSGGGLDDSGILRNR